MAGTSSATNQPIPNLGAVILSGGQSRRMGTDKCQLEFQGDTLLQHVVNRAARVASPVIVAGGNRPPQIEDPSTVTFVPDQHGDVGPLEGIRVGLRELRKSVEFSFVTGCDSPLIEPDLILHLFQQIQDQQAVVPVQGDRVFGLTAVYRTDIDQAIQMLIDQDYRRVQDLSKHLNARFIDVNSLKEFDPGLGSFFNVNSEGDYQRLLKQFG